MDVQSTIFSSCNLSPECKRKHLGGCKNYDDVHLKKFSKKTFDVRTCLNECEKRTKCIGFSLGRKGSSTGLCVLLKSDVQGNECKKDGNFNWEYYRKDDCTKTAVTGASSKK